MIILVSLFKKKIKILFYEYWKVLVVYKPYCIKFYQGKKILK